MAVSNYTATTTSGTAVAANEARQVLVITNLDNSKGVFLNTISAAEVNKGIYLAPNGGVWQMDKYFYTRDAITVITASGTVLISIYET